MASLPCAIHTLYPHTVYLTGREVCIWIPFPVPYIAVYGRRILQGRVLGVCVYTYPTAHLEEFLRAQREEWRLAALARGDGDGVTHTTPVGHAVYPWIATVTQG